MNNPPIKLTNDQFQVINRLLAIATIAIKDNGWHHHDPAIKAGQKLLAVCEVDEVTFDLASILSPGWDKEAA